MDFFRVALMQRIFMDLLSEMIWNMMQGLPHQDADESTTLAVHYLTTQHCGPYTGAAGKFSSISLVSIIFTAVMNTSRSEESQTHVRVWAPGVEAGGGGGGKGVMAAAEDARVNSRILAEVW